MFDRNQPDRYQAPGRPQGAPYGALPGTTPSGTVIINGQRVSAVPREGFLTMAFVWMFVALIVSAISAYFVFASPAVQSFVLGAYLPLILGELALVFVISLGINRLGAIPALALLFVYALLNGLTIGAIVLVYVAGGATSAVVSSFVGASAIFAAAAAFGFITKRDLSSLGGILTVGVIGLVVMSFVQLFFFGSNDTFSLIIGIAGVVIFTGLTVYWVQQLKNGELNGVRDSQAASVLGALTLYILFINLFLSLLRIFGGGRD